MTDLVPEIRETAVAWPVGRSRGNLRRYLVRRLGLSCATLFLVAATVFAATVALPGNAARAILGKSATPERLAALEKQLNLDQPPLQQFWDWLTGLLRGDLGTSLTSAEPVTSVIGTRLLNSGLLVLLATVIAVPLALVIGSWLAHNADRWVDVSAGVVTLVLVALPEFVIDIGVVIVFATTVVHVFPPVSLLAPGEHALDHPSLVVLPVLTLVVSVLPYMVRMVRVTFIEVMGSEYIEMARLKGLSERRIQLAHVLPNAIGPSLQVIAGQLAWLAGGVVLVEYVFAFPGIGQGLTTAITARDVPVIQAATVMLATFYVLTNLVADLIVVMLTPKARMALR